MIPVISFGSLVWLYVAGVVTGTALCAGLFYWATRKRKK